MEAGGQLTKVKPEGRGPPDGAGGMMSHGGDEGATRPGSHEPMWSRWVEGQRRSPGLGGWRRRLGYSNSEVAGNWRFQSSSDSPVSLC